jgi:hypothetical protein
MPSVQSRATIWWMIIMLKEKAVVEGDMHEQKKDLELYALGLRDS